MMYGLKTLIKKILFFFSFQIPKKITSPSQAVNSIKHKPNIVQFYELKYLASLLSQINQKKYYSELLTVLLPEYEQPAAKFTRFIGQGAGKFTFNSYRILNREGNLSFEKVYYSDAKKTKSVKWFYQNYFDFIKGVYNAPALLSFHDGELVSVFNYEFFELTQESFDEKLMVEISKKLNNLSETHEKSLDEKVPDYLKDFEKHNAYDGYIGIAKEKLNKNSLSIEWFENSVSNGKHVFSHGDLHTENIYKDNVLIDWDFFGYYPVGLELAQMYCQMLSRKQKLESENPTEWFETNYHLFFGVNYEEAYKNFVFFLYVFCQTLFTRGNCLTLEPLLINKLHELQKTKIIL